jgi:hypothetical protein
VHFKEGQLVSKDDPLIDIDSRPYRATLLQAQGALERDENILAQARMDLERYRDAWNRKAIAKQFLDDQEKIVLQDEGTVTLRHRASRVIAGADLTVTQGRPRSMEIDERTCSIRNPRPNSLIDPPRGSGRSPAKSLETTALPGPSVAPAKGLAPPRSLPACTRLRHRRSRSRQTLDRPCPPALESRARQA